jgi:hypothetical protein
MGSGGTEMGSVWNGTKLRARKKRGQSQVLTQTLFLRQSARDGATVTHRAAARGGRGRSLGVSV